MKKVLKSLLLLSCRSPFLDDSKIYVPLASLYLKSYINKYLPDVDVVIGDDNYDLNKPELFEPYDAIGISITTPQSKEAYKILDTIKKYYPEKVVIAGGPHVRYYIREIIEAGEPYDYLVPLDGEKVLVGILKGDTKEFSNKYTRFGLNNSKKIIVDVIENPKILVHEMSKEEILNQPRPDRTSKNAVKVIKRYKYMLGDKKATTMMTARGCPGQCKFCEHAMTSVRWSSLDSIKAQLDDIKNLGYDGVYIFDDLFTISIDKFKPIAEELKKRNLIYRCNIQAKYFTQNGEEFARLLSETGCYEVGFGAESGSQKILDNTNKKTTVEMNYKAVEYAKKYGIRVKAFILLGLPGEDWNTLKDTERFIATSGIDEFAPYVYMPYKGTQIRDSLDRNEDIGIKMLTPEVAGAYGIKGGETVYEIMTSALSADNLKSFRNYLLIKYNDLDKEAWKRKFYDTQIITGEGYANLVSLSLIRVLIRTEGHLDLGMGNIYRSIRIAKKFQELYSVKLRFIMDDASIIGIKKILDAGFKVDVADFKNTEGYMNYIKEFNPNIIINDLLNIEDDYIKNLKKLNVLVVNFENQEYIKSREDVDIVFNLLHENKGTKVKYYHGPKYAPLHNSFRNSKIKKIDKGCKNFLLVCGGSDLSGFTLRIAKLLNKLPDIKTTIFLNPSFGYHEQLYNLLKYLDKDRFTIRYDVEYNQKDFEDIDLAIFFGSNICYELAASGIPGIMLSQNELEEERSKLLEKYGTCINLGNVNKLKDEELLDAIQKLSGDVELRKITTNIGKSLVDGYGTDRIVEAIFNGLKEKNIAFR